MIILPLTPIFLLLGGGLLLRSICPALVYCVIQCCPFRRGPSHRLAFSFWPLSRSLSRPSVRGNILHPESLGCIVCHQKCRLLMLCWCYRFYHPPLPCISVCMLICYSLHVRNFITPGFPSNSTTTSSLITVYIPLHSWVGFLPPPKLPFSFPHLP